LVQKELKVEMGKVTKHKTGNISSVPIVLQIHSPNGKYYCLQINCFVQNTFEFALSVTCL